MDAMVEVRLMNGHDEEYLNKLAESKRKKKLIESFLTDQLRRMIVSVNGDSSAALIAEFVNHMPARDSRHLRTMYQYVVPDVKLAQEFLERLLKQKEDENKATEEAMNKAKGGSAR